MEIEWGMKKHLERKLEKNIQKLFLLKKYLGKKKTRNFFSELHFFY